MKKAIRYAIILLLLSVQVLFLSGIFRENASGYLIPISVLSIVILLFYSYLKRSLHEEHHEYESLAVAMWVPVGAVLCYYLNQGLQLGAVLAAAIIGTLASFLPSLRPRSAYLQQLPASLYCGAFVGMSSPKVAAGPGFVLVAGVVTAIFLVVSKSIMKGVGGKLGTLAFLGVLLTYLIYFFDSL